MGKHILILLIGNIRYDGRVKKEIKSLQRFGYKISLAITEFDEDDNKSNYSYTIYQLPLPAGTNIKNRITNKIQYTRQLGKIINKIKPDFIHCNDSTIFYVSRWIKKIRVVYDAHELWPEKQNGYRKTITNYLERRKLKDVYKVILPQIDRLNYFFFKNKDIIKKDQLYLLENFPQRNEHKSINYFEKKFGVKHKRKVLSYVGILNDARKIIEIVEAVAKIEGLLFYIFGPSEKAYQQKLESTIQNLNVGDRVFLHDRIPHEEVIEVSNSSDYGVVFYSSENLNSYFCASNKLYENLNCGMAVLTNNIAGTARIIKNGINGWLIDEINMDEICKGLKELTKISLKENSEYYWENQDEILKEVYQ